MKCQYTAINFWNDNEMSVHIGHLLECYLNVSTQRSHSGVTMKCQYTAVIVGSDTDVNTQQSARDTIVHPDDRC